MEFILRFLLKIISNIINKLHFNFYKNTNIHYIGGGRDHPSIYRIGIQRGK